MSFVRPEAREGLLRFRPILIAIAVLLLGLWWVLAGHGILFWVGWVTIISGGILLWTGFQRLRFQSGKGGPGVVRVDEGAIGYFGPLDGGAVALSEMSKLCLDPTGKPHHWILAQPGQPDLHIPLTAEGAEGLFDAFASLPGIRTEYMLSQMGRSGTAKTTIWTRERFTALK